jgi:hypothetical protein
MTPRITASRGMFRGEHFLGKQNKGKRRLTCDTGEERLIYLAFAILLRVHYISVREPEEQDLFIES